MTHFSRLTDIVTCNLTELLRTSDNPAQTLAEVVSEMTEGIAGARRSLETSHRNVDRLTTEIAQHVASSREWHDRAKIALRENNDHEAKQCIMRRREYEALVGGLEQQHRAAVATHDHLATTLRALEARLADATRRQALLSSTPESAPPVDPSVDDDLASELAALRREIGGLG